MSKRQWIIIGAGVFWNIKLTADYMNVKERLLQIFRLNCQNLSQIWQSRTLKDPYNFDFLSLREEYDEKELEDALVNQITQFLLELGTGFFATMSSGKFKV